MPVEKKRGNLYPVRVYNPSTGRMDYVKGFKDRRRKHSDAKKLFNELTEKMQRTGGSRLPTVGEFAAHWTEAYPRSEQTNMHNQERVSLFVKEHKERRLDSITRPEARAWALKNKRRVSAVRAMFNDACDDYPTLLNPFSNLKLDYAATRKAAKLRKSPLTAVELDRLADVALEHHGEVYGPMVRAMILFAAYSGLRPGELYALRWPDIGTDTIRVERQYSAALHRVIDPKYGSKGEIALFPPARQALEEMLRCPHIQRTPSGLVFTTAYGKQLTQSGLHYAWNPVRVAFGMPKLRFDSLRHYCASWMANDLGLDRRMVAKQLRNSPEVADAFYIHDDPDALRKMRDAYWAAQRLRPVGGEQAG